jgi:hypothetical protein
LFLLIIIIPAWTYEPLTDEEIKQYWSSLSEEERLEEIRKLDILEHTSPIIEGGEYIALLTKDGTLIIYPKSIMFLSIGHLAYEIELPEYHIEDFVPPAQKKKYFLAGIGGTIIALLTTAASGEESLIKYGINAGVGILIGLCCEYLR